VVPAFFGAVVDCSAAAVCLAVFAAGVADGWEEGGGDEYFLHSEEWVFGGDVCLPEWVSVLVYELYAGSYGV
jgi:hypothetical protein